MSQPRIGDILVRRGVVDRSRVEVAAALLTEGGKRLGQVLIDLGLASEAQVAEALAEQLNILFYSTLKDRDLRDLRRWLPEHLARQCKAVPVEARPEGLVLALWDPTDVQAARVIEQTLRTPIIVAAAPFTEVLEVLEQLYASLGPGPGGLRRQRVAHDMVLLLGRSVRVAIQETTGRIFLKLRAGGEILDLSPEQAAELFADLLAVAREHAEIMGRIRTGSAAPPAGLN